MKINQSWLRVQSPVSCQTLSQHQRDFPSKWQQRFSLVLSAACTVHKSRALSFCSLNNYTVIAVAYFCLTIENQNRDIFDLLGIWLSPSSLLRKCSLFTKTSHKTQRWEFLAHLVCCLSQKKSHPKEKEKASVLTQTSFVTKWLNPNTWLTEIC